MKTRLLPLLFAFLACASWAKPAPRAKPAPSGNTTITSVRLEYDYEKSMIFLDDNVKVVDPEFILTGDHAVVLLEATNEVREVRVRGNVHVVSEERSAHCDNAIFYKTEGKIVMTGGAYLQRGTDRLSGKKITIWTDLERLECVPAKLTIRSPLLKKNRKRNPSDQPTVITSDRMEYDKKEAKILFERNVKVEDPQYRLTSDRAIVMLHGSEDVSQVRAIGHVRIFDDDRECTCDEANYFRATGKITMKGEVRVRHGEDTLVTRDGTLWSNEDSAECSPARVIIRSKSAHQKPGQAGETVVTATRGKYNYREGAISLEDNVHVAAPQYKMTCDRAIVLLQDKKELDQIKALGHVVIIEEGRTTRSNEAVYLHAENKATLKGDVLVQREGNDNYWGDQVEIWIGEKRVEGGRSRLRIESEMGDEAETPPAGPETAPVAAP